MSSRKLITLILPSANNLQIVFTLTPPSIVWLRTVLWCSHAFDATDLRLNLPFPNSFFSHRISARRKYTKRGNKSPNMYFAVGLKCLKCRVKTSNVPIKQHQVKISINIYSFSVIEVIDHIGLLNILHRLLFYNNITLHGGANICTRHLLFKILPFSRRVNGVNKNCKKWWILFALTLSFCSKHKFYWTFNNIVEMWTETVHQSILGGVVLDHFPVSLTKDMPEHALNRLTL